MKKLYFAYVLLLLTVGAFLSSTDAGTITRCTKSTGGTSFTEGTIPSADDWNCDHDTVFSEINGSLTNANISPSAAIVGTKLRLGVTGIIFGADTTFTGNSVTGIVLGNETSVPTAYSGAICSTAFIRQLTSFGVPVCEQVNLGTDVTGNLSLSGNVQSGAVTGVVIARTDTSVTAYAGSLTCASGSFITSLSALLDPTCAIGLESGTWSDVSSSRAVTTVYQNTSGKKRRVIGSLNISDATSTVIIDVQVGSANPPTIVIQKLGGVNDTSGSGGYQQFSFEVPNNWYYRVNVTTAGGASVGDNAWAELDE